MTSGLDTKATTREAWLRERMTGIGASDAGAACGISPWKTPWELYLEKTGELPAKEMTKAMRWGLKLEETIATAYEEETGRALSQPEGMLRHEDHPFMLATLDRVADDGRIVELKTASAFAADDWGEAGTDHIPSVYLCQVQHQMAVASKELADVPVLIGGSDFRIYTVRRDEEMIELLIGTEQQFWGRVQRREPPEPSWTSPNTLALLKRLHGVEDALEIPLPAEAVDELASFEDAKQKIKEWECERDAAQAKLLSRMGAAGLAFLPDGTTLSRKTIQRAAYSVEAGQYVRFSVKKPKAR